MKRIVTILLFVPLLASANPGTPPKPSQVFNPVNYGAVGDNNTNNTAAFAACMNDLVAHGGGRFFVPWGIYLVDSFAVPGIPGPEMMIIEIVGETSPAFLYGTIAISNIFPRGGSVIKSTSTTATSVFRVNPGGFNGPFSFVNIVLQNIDFRAYNNPQIHGVDARNALFFRMENCSVNTDIYSINAAQPSFGKAGILMPRSDNGAMSVLYNVTISGWDTALVATEHTEGYFLNIYGCYQGINIASIFGSHSAKFGSVRMGGVKYGIVANSFSKFKVDYLDVEHLDSATQAALGQQWQLTVADIYDPNNVAHADISYRIVGASGSNNSFKVVGGLFLNCSEVGRGNSAQTYYVGDMSTIYPGYNALIVGGPGKGAAIDLVYNGRRIGEFYANDMENAYFYSDQGFGIVYNVNNVFFPHALKLFPTGKVQIGYYNAGVLVTDNQGIITARPDLLSALEELAATVKKQQKEIEELKAKR